MSVSSPHPLYSIHLEEWVQMRDTYGGERPVKARGTAYLPATSGMIMDGMVPGGSATSKGYMAYQAYKARAKYPELVKEAVQSMVGVMHSKPATIELPEALEPMRNKATLANESLEMLLRRITEEQLTTGRAGLLLDVPTLDSVAAAAAVPYIAFYLAETIINWDPGERDKPKPEALNLVVLRETEQVRTGDGFTWETKEKYRVLMLGDLIENEGAGEANYRVGTFVGDQVSFSNAAMIEPFLRGNKLQRIPFVFINPKDIVSEPDSPPLMGLSNDSLTIYRSEADYRQALFMQGQDTLVVIGEPDQERTFRTGAGAAITLMQGGDAKYIGVDSQGLPEMREALQNDYDRASTKAGELINETSRQRESGEALRVRVGARTTTLRSLAITAAFALQELLRVAAIWVGADPEEVIVTPNLDFADDGMTGKDLLDIMSAKGLGAPLSMESVHAIMRAKGMTELDYEDEITKLTEEMDLEFVPKPSTNEDGPEGDDTSGKGAPAKGGKAA